MIPMQCDFQEFTLEPFLQDTLTWKFSTVLSTVTKSALCAPMLSHTACVPLCHRQQHPLCPWRHHGLWYHLQHHELKLIPGFLLGLLLSLQSASLQLPQEWYPDSQLDFGWTPDSTPIKRMFGIKTKTQCSQSNMDSLKGIAEPQKLWVTILRGGSKSLSAESRGQR